MKTQIFTCGCGYKYCAIPEEMENFSDWECPNCEATNTFPQSEIPKPEMDEDNYVNTRILISRIEFIELDKHMQNYVINFRDGTKMHYRGTKTLLFEGDKLLIK